MQRSVRSIIVLQMAIAASAIASHASATNGMNPVAFGAAPAGRGGADLAVATDTSAMNTNPAGITQNKMRADASVSLLIPSLTLNDRAATPQGAMELNMDKAGESKLFPLVNLGFSTHVFDGLYAGLAFVTQGGMGAEFKGLNTFSDADPTTMSQPVPGQYDTYSQIMYLKLVPTLAWRFEDVATDVDVSLGAGFNIGMSKMEFRHGGFAFPEQDGDGIYAPHSVEFSSDYAIGYAVRLGLLVQLADAVGVGASYQTKAKLPYEGTATVDKQLDYDSKMDFAWPQEVGVGVSARPIKPLLLVADLRWVEWSDTMDTVTLEGNAAAQAPPGYESLTLPFQMRWRDQVVAAVGAEYSVVADVALRIGYNYGKSPVEPDGINPLFPAVSEHHLTLGAGARVLAGLGFDAAVEYSPKNTVSSNAQNQMALQPGTNTPSGYSFDVAMSQLTVHLGARYLFD
ncbi:MAG: outer membrane protein transport protein [Polyangiaceae bacterium]